RKGGRPFVDPLPRCVLLRRAGKRARRGGAGHMMARTLKAALVAALAWMASVASPTSAASQETLRAGKAVPEACAFIPLDVCVQNGIFKKHGLKVEITSFGGGARLLQGMTADSIDIGLGSGPEMAYIEKGAPVKAVAMVVGPPIYIVLLVR